MIFTCLLYTSKVTDDLKAKIVSDLETRLDMVNKDLEAIEFQAQRILADEAKVDAVSYTHLDVYKRQRWYYYRRLLYS